MKTAILFFFALFLGLFAHSQDVNKARDYFLSGQYEEAANEYDLVLPLAEKEYGENDTIHFTKILYDAAVAYSYSYQNDKAEKTCFRILSIYELLHATEDIGYAIYLNELASEYNRMARYEDSEPLIKKALQIIKINNGEKDYGYANFLNNLGITYTQMGYYEKAEPLHRKALKILYDLGLERDSYYGMTLGYLASLYQAMGRFEEAANNYSQAVEITKLTLGINHEFYGRYVQYYAFILQQLGRYKEAESLYKQALEIYRNQTSVNNHYHTRLLLNLANLYQSVGRSDTVEALILETLEIDRKLLGENHPDYAKCLTTLASFYQSVGKYEQSESLYFRALFINQKQLGETHSDYIDLVNNLSQLYQKLGKNDSAYMMMIKAFSGFQYNVRTNTGFLSSAELEEFLNKFLFSLDRYQSFNNEQLTKHPGFAGFSYDIELARKGILLKSALEVKANILESGDTSLVNAYLGLLSLRRQINRLIISPTDRTPEYLDKLKEQANEMEKILTLKSKEYENIRNKSNITWKEIQQHLKPGEAAIEFTNFHYFDGDKATDSVLYSAVLIRYSDTIPQMVALTDESHLKNAIPPPNNHGKVNLAYSGNNQVPTLKSELYTSNESTIYDLVWHPIEGLLTGIRTIFFSPSGLLNQISIAAVPCRNSKLLVDIYNLVQLNTTRILAFSMEQESLKSAVVYGGINYDADTAKLLTASKKYVKEDTESSSIRRSHTGDTRYGFRFLPGSKEEAEVITAKLVDRGISTTIYTGADAVEESFVALSGKNSPSLIHMSTHGFYFRKDTSDIRKRPVIISNDFDLEFKYSEDPLLRSGLLMSGANLTWKSLTLPPNIEDGILTAKEVSNMNLMNTQLVVLSACQTGLGDLKGSEGVEGLQRGFKMAGARYIMMSLWEVPDKETTEFMASFYDNWLGGKNIQDAFHATQVTMKNKYKNEPYKWAAFVLTE